MNATTMQDCWNRIGVQGDKSCPELNRHIHCRNCPTFEQGAHALLNRTPPAGYIEEWTQFLARAKETEVGFTDTAMVFRIGPEWLALSARFCVEIVSMRPIRRVPHRSDRMLLGLASVRGELLLCFALAHLLGLEPTSRLEPASRLERVALSGGVFQNDLLLALTTNGLRRRGFQVYSHHLVPPNDGGIVLGQAAVALKRMKNEEGCRL